MLQKNEPTDFITEKSGLNIVKGQKEYTNSMNFVDTAAVLSNCDLIITNDSCIVHMAGAMGIKTALLLSYVPEWRWGTEGSKCAWYESVVIYRQRLSGGWLELMKEIKKDMNTLIG